MHNALEPDVDDETTGDRPSQRRRTLATVGVAAAALLVAGAVYSVMKTQDETSAQTDQPLSTTASSPSATTPQTYRDDGTQLQGTYRMVVGMDDNVVPIQADLTFGGQGWLADNYPVLAYTGGVAVYQPLALAAGNGCLTDAPNTEVGDTPEAIAAQLAKLPDSTVVEAPETVQAFGHDTVHLRERIDQQCGDGIYRVALTLRGGHGISYNDTTQDVLIDFWVMDLGSGHPVVVETWHQAGTSGELVDQITSTRDSISFVPAG